MVGESRIAVVFGLFETGLGVIRSLGQKGIKVIGIDSRKDVGWYSRYVEPILSPHPITEENEFVEWIINKFNNNKDKIPAFLTSDDFLMSFSRNREILQRFFLINMVEHKSLELISNKFSQYKIAVSSGINMPSTFLIKTLIDLKELPEQIVYPVFIKGMDVNEWRANIHSSLKGYIANNKNELKNKTSEIIEKGVKIIVQEVIEGPDTNHFKYCCYINKSGNILAEFTLQKIRQNPVHFGVGAVIKSIHKPELMHEGRKLFSGIGFTGIGSAEFKYDNRDGKLKLIEINPRYWQQNYLSTVCGVNFAYINFLDLLNVDQQIVNGFDSGVKWVNRYLDFNSFIKYRKEGSLTFVEWRKSLSGKKTYSDFTWDDPLPILFEIRFGKRLLLLPRFIMNRLLRD